MALHLSKPSTCNVVLIVSMVTRFNDTPMKSEKGLHDGSSPNDNDLDLPHAVDTPPVGESFRNPYLDLNMTLSVSSATDPLSCQS